MVYAESVPSSVLPCPRLLPFPNPKSIWTSKGETFLRVGPQRFSTGDPLGNLRAARILPRNSLPRFLSFSFCQSFLAMRRGGFAASLKVHIKFLCVAQVLTLTLLHSRPAMRKSETYKGSCIIVWVTFSGKRKLFNHMTLFNANVRHEMRALNIYVSDFSGGCKLFDTMTIIIESPIPCLVV